MFLIIMIVLIKDRLIMDKLISNLVQIMNRSNYRYKRLKKSNSIMLKANKEND